VNTRREWSCGWVTVRKSRTLDDVENESFLRDFESASRLVVLDVDPEIRSQGTLITAFKSSQ